MTAGMNHSENPNLRLVRQWAGCGTPQNKPLAAAKWIFLAIHQKDVPPSLRAQAHSSLARNWLELAVEGGPGTMNITHLYDAGNSANEAAALGLVSTAVLEVAQRIESAGFRRPKDNRFPEHSTERFERLTDLWKALDARIALEMAEEDSKREAKVSKDPLSYFCASEDCGIVVTKSTLRKCGGRCPPALKPSYCSKHCQKTVRFLSRTLNGLVHLPCRIGNTMNYTANQTLHNRVSVRLIARAQLLLSSDRTRWRMRDPKGSDIGEQSGFSWLFRLS